MIKDELLLGDSIEIVKGFDECSIHAIISDIPYGIGCDDWDVLHANTNSALGGASAGVLQNLLGSERRIIEDGLPARTNMAEDPYFPHRYGLPALEAALDAHAPLDLVIIHTGVNELKHMFGLSAGMIALGAEKMIAAARESRYGYPPPKALLIAPPPLKENVGDLQLGYSFGPIAYKKSLELGQAYKDTAERCGCAFLDCALLGFELNDLDGLHYCAGDHAKLGKAVADLVAACNVDALQAEKAASLAWSSAFFLRAPAWKDSMARRQDEPCCGGSRRRLARALHDGRGQAA